MNVRECKIEWCTRVHYGRGYCSPHWQQWHDGKEPGVIRAFTPKTCAGPECDQQAICKGLCGSHYDQQRRLGALKPLYQTQRPRGATLERDALGRKQCAQCRNWFPEDVFGPQKKNIDGLRGECREFRARYNARSKDQRRAFLLKKKFGLTVERYNEMLEAQGGTCAICPRTTDEFDRAFAVDHDHACCPEAGQSCGKCVRGLLCPTHNTALGSFQDDPTTLRRAADYVEAYR